MDAETFKELWPYFRHVLADVAHKYGPFAVILIALIVFHLWSTNRLWTARLADKDKEIDRLVTERDRLQEVILSKRLTSNKRT